MQSFLGAFCDLPLPKALMMFVLSQFTFIQASWKEDSVSHKTATSRAIASAHPMSQLKVAQLGVNFHAAQRPVTVMTRSPHGPRPVPEPTQPQTNH